MTNCDEEIMSKKKKLCFEELRAVKVLGKGAMGTVLLVVRDGFKDQPFALKVISKYDKEDQQWFKKSKRIVREREILSSLQHPFLPSLMGEVETESIVGWAVEYCPGGDLHHLRQMQPDKTFSESAIRFYAAEVLLALEHLHSQGIVYRDLKPENILVQSSGHIMLTDFDLSKRLPRQSNFGTIEIDQKHEQQQKVQKNSCKQYGGWFALRTILSSKQKKPCPPNSPSNRVSPTDLSQSRTNSFVGTDEYVAPEIINGHGHDFSVDWWSLGILVYEMLYGKTPFKGSNKKETFARILFARPNIMGPSNPLHDLIVRLLEKDPQKRLGFCKGADDVKSHIFFRGVEWDSVQQVCRPPVVPDITTSHYCTDDMLTSNLQNFLHALNSEEEETSDSEVDGLF